MVPAKTLIPVDDNERTGNPECVVSRSIEAIFLTLSLSSRVSTCVFIMWPAVYSSRFNLQDIMYYVKKQKKTNALCVEDGQQICIWLNDIKNR